MCNMLKWLFNVCFIFLTKGFKATIHIYIIHIDISINIPDFHRIELSFVVRVIWYSAPILVLAKVNKRNKYVFFVSTAMGKDYCAIKDCHNTTGTIGRFNKSVKLHHLPKKQSLRSAWIRAISRSNYKGGHHTYVCSDHFPDGESMRCQRYSSPKRRRKSTKNVQQETAEKL